MIHWLYLIYCIMVNAYTGKVLLSADRFLAFGVLGVFELFITALVLQFIVEKGDK